MRIFNTKVFDDVISGTATTWLTPAEFDGLIGQADSFAVQAITEGIGGTLPSLTVRSEHSSDGQNWIPTGATEIEVSPMVENGTYWGAYAPLFLPRLGAKVRLRIALGNTSPKCRLKLYVTGRNWPI